MNNFAQYKLNNIGDLEVFIRFDTPRFLEFTQLINSKLDALPIGGTLRVTDCTSLPKQYNLTVKWLCWRAFVSHHAISKLDKNEAKRTIRYDMLPDYSGAKKCIGKKTR